MGSVFQDTVFGNSFLRQKWTLFLRCLQDDLIVSVILPHIARVDVAMDSEVRLKVVELVVDLAETCTSDHFFQLFDVIKKVTYFCVLLLISLK